MFKKLVKYEFKAIGKWYLGIYAAVLVLSGVLGFWLQALFVRAQADNMVEPRTGEAILLGTSFMTFGILIAALFLSTFVLVINRFRKNVYGRQGYLTMTLPVNSHQIILSKLLVSVIWYSLATITALLSIFIIFLAILKSDNEIFYSFSDWISSFGQMNWTMAFSWVVYLLIVTIARVLLIYFAISVGQLFKDHRLLFAILTYIGISIILSVFVNLFLFNTTADYLISAYPNPFLALFNIILGFAYYFGTHFIMTKKLNLQ
ncbi:ABC transporter permease [Streptococcus suis]|nr:ABC transporter permease [Streptococcus suis]